MIASNNEPLDDILKQYPYNVNKIRLEKYFPDRGVWWIHTNKGLKVLKKLPCRENRLKFILEGIFYLQSQGINIPKIHKTINKELYVNFDGICYILMEAIDGSVPLYSDVTKFKTVITEMGKFHRVSCGYKPSSECYIPSRLGECFKMYTQKYNMLKKYYIQENKKISHTVFEETAIRELPYFLKRIEDIQIDLAKSKYALWVDKLSKSGGLSHTDFSIWNLIITPAKKLYILDFDKLSIGLPIWDIRMLFFQIMNHIEPFTKQNLEAILNWYQNTNPLTADEWHVVKLHLLYPYMVDRIIKLYIRKAIDLSEDEYLLELKKAIESEKSMIHKLEGYEDIIDKFI